MHAARLESSNRLKQTLAVLQQAGKVGVTTWQIQDATGSMAPATDISELRRNGYAILCEYDGTTATGRKAYRYKLGEAQ